MSNNNSIKRNSFELSAGVVADVDHHHLRLIRENVRQFLSRSGQLMDGPEVRLLDIAPQIHEGARPHFPRAQVKTLDIDPASSADYIADLCQDNSVKIPDEMFDIVVCTEVLEHVLNPFKAANEIRRILKPGGCMLASSPFNFRIHGPLPDCWRFTEHGWRALLAEFTAIEITALDDRSRFLAPIHYTVTAIKPRA